MTDNRMILIDKLEKNKNAIQKIVNSVAEKTNYTIMIKSIKASFDKHMNTLYIDCDCGFIMVSDFGCMTYYINGVYSGNSEKKDVIDLIDEYKNLIVEVE